MIDPALLPLWTRPGLTCLPESRGLMRQFRQPEQLCYQHTRRAAHQVGCVWAEASQGQPEIENPANWGWQLLGEEWQICWTADSPIAQCCHQLTKCGCKSGCRGKCKCYKLGMNCTTLCACRCEV